MKRIVYVVMGVLLFLLGISFAYKNAEVVELRYYFGLSWATPLAVMVLVAFALGVGAGFLASLRMVVQMQRQLVQARKEVRQIEQEVINLRSLPIKDVL